MIKGLELFKCCCFIENKIIKRKIKKLNYLLTNNTISNVVEPIAAKIAITNNTI